MKLSVGDLVGGKYRLDAVLGEGGFGIVYRATTVGTNRPVAVKILKPGPEGYDSSRKERFLRELRAIGALQDPHTLTLFDSGQTEDGSPYMITEYVEGEDLEVLLARRGTLTPPEAVHVLLQVLYSLREAHAVGILHRDIKPANIRVYRHHDDPLRVKVLDFGLAKSFRRDEVRLTGVGRAIGTPRYMAPEQLTGDTLSPSTDIYAAGVVAYEMLLGRTLFDAGTRDIPASYPLAPELRQIVNNMLRPNIEARYKVTQEVIDQLLPIRRGANRSEPPRAPDIDVVTPPIEPEAQVLASQATTAANAIPRLPLTAAIVAVGALALAAALLKLAPEQTPTVPNSRPISVVSASSNSLVKVAAPPEPPPLAIDMGSEAGSFVEVMRSGTTTLGYSAYIPQTRREGTALIVFAAWTETHTMDLREVPLITSVADRTGMVVVGLGGMGHHVPKSAVRALWWILDAAAESLAIDYTQVYLVGDWGAVNDIICAPPVMAVAVSSSRYFRPDCPHRMLRVAGEPFEPKALPVDELTLDTVSTFFLGVQKPHDDRTRGVETEDQK